MRFLLTLVFCGILLNVNSQAQYVSFRIDSAVRAAMEARQIPGMQVLVVKYGLVIKKGQYGFANLDDRLPVTDSTKFSIAAMSNAMTCAGIFLLMEDGKLRIDDTLGKYFDSLPAGWDSITLRQLMNHTSGLPDDFEEGDGYFCSKESENAFFTALKEKSLKFQPGSAFHYSCGPFILGMIIAKVSGESYPDFMKHRIFDKVGMTNTMINDGDGIISNRAVGYTLRDNKIVHGQYISPAALSRGDAGVLTTVTDMLKWYNALQNNTLLTKENTNAMFAPGILNDGSLSPGGFGWLLSPYRDHALISHKGELRTGFDSYIEMYPEDHVCIILLTNLYHARSSEISKDIIGLFDPDYGRASRMDSVADPDSVRTILIKNYFTDLGRNLDTTRQAAREMHLPFYPADETRLLQFRDVEEFSFVKTIKLTEVKKNVFGDKVQNIYLYKVKSKDQPLRYYAFFMNPSAKLVYMEYEE